MIDNILIVSPPDYIHNQCFFEIALSFASALKSLGHEVCVTTNANDCDGSTLVFGAHLIARMDGNIEGDYILYQTEQLGASDSLFEDDKYIDLLKKFPVWDYSLNNIAYLRERGVEAKHVPIGYSKCMENIKTGRSASQVGGGKNGKQRVDFAEWSGVYPPVGNDSKFIQDIDICFFGSMNERRQNIIDRLKKITVPITRPDGITDEVPLTIATPIAYGGFRDKLIARSKIVLNMHYYDSAIFEIFRCSHLFANKKTVISEIGKDVKLEESYWPSDAFVEYDGLIDKCIELLQNNERRQSVATFSHDVFKTTTQADILKASL